MSDELQLAVSPEVLEHVRANLNAQLAKSITDALGWKVREATEKFFADEIQPAVMAQLASQKDPLIAASIVGASNALRAATDALAAEMEKRLTASPHTVTEALKVLLRGY